jgi:hypothetical protein
MDVVTSGRRKPVAKGRRQFTALLLVQEETCIVVGQCLEERTNTSTPASTEASDEINDYGFRIRTSGWHGIRGAVSTLTGEWPLLESDLDECLCMKRFAASEKVRGRIVAEADARVCDAYQRLMW